MADIVNNPKSIYQTDNLAEGLRKAREFRGISLKACASLIGIPANRLLNYEKGKYFPSLPEAEALSFIYGLPLEALFEPQEYPEFFKLPNASQLNQLLQIRQQIITTKLKIAIEKSGKSLKDISKISNIPQSRIKRYLDGKTAIPVDDLENLSQCLDSGIDNYSDFESPIGIWQALQRKKLSYSRLPENVRKFFEDQENWSYMEIIQKLRGFSPENLDAISESVSQLADLIRTDQQPGE